MDTDFTKILVWNMLVLNKIQFAQLEMDFPSHHIIEKFKAVGPNGSKQGDIHVCSHSYSGMQQQ